jgi:hypothetical protein
MPGNNFSYRDEEGTFPGDQMPFKLFQQRFIAVMSHAFWLEYLSNSAIKGSEETSGC